MREIRLFGSEGGAAHARPYPYLVRPGSWWKRKRL